MVSLTPLTGIAIGTLTGIIPGIHPNFTAALLSNTNLTNLTVIIYISALTHTFLNTIPTIHLSSPDPESALILHPSQEYAQEGRAHEAVILTLMGSLISLIFIASLFPLSLKIIKPLYHSIKNVIPFLILATSIFMIYRQKNKKTAAMIFLLSGLLGILTLNKEFNEPFLPLFTGLFGIPSLLINLNKHKVKQKITEPRLSMKNFRTIPLSTLFGSLFSFLPSLGPAQAAAVQTEITKTKTRRNFLITVGALNTINMLFSLVTLNELNKARNGAVAIIKSLNHTDPTQIANLFYFSLAIAFPCTLLCITLSRLFVKLRNKINIKKLSILTILFLVTVTSIISKTYGIIILLFSTLIGMLPYKLETNKTVLMGCLMLPTMLFYFSRIF